MLNPRALVAIILLTATPALAEELVITPSSSRMALQDDTKMMYLENRGEVNLFFKFGDDSITATTTDYSLPAGFTLAVMTTTDRYLAAITAADTTKLQITELNRDMMERLAVGAGNLGEIELGAPGVPSQGFGSGRVVSEDTSWHLLTRAGNGTVSLIKNLSQHECEFARARALGLPATDEEKQRAEEASRREVIERKRYLWEHRKECVRLGPDRTSCPSGPFDQAEIDDKGQIVSETISSGVTMSVSEGYIMSAECFQ